MYIRFALASLMLINGVLSLLCVSALCTLSQKVTFVLCVQACCVLKAKHSLFLSSLMSPPCSCLIVGGNAVTCLLLMFLINNYRLAFTDAWETAMLLHNL